MSIISLADIRPERQIQRKHPSSSHVYKVKYLQLKYPVSIPEKISICLNRSCAESLMMTFQVNNATCPQVKNG